MSDKECHENIFKLIWHCQDINISNFEFNDVICSTGLDN